LNRAIKFIRDLQTTISDGQFEQENFTEISGGSVLINSNISSIFHQRGALCPAMNIPSCDLFTPLCHGRQSKSALSQLFAELIICPVPHPPNTWPIIAALYRRPRRTPFHITGAHNSSTRTVAEQPLVGSESIEDGVQALRSRKFSVESTIIQFNAERRP
jgi:hypothetical protein